MKAHLDFWCMKPMAAVMLFLGGFTVIQASEPTSLGKGRAFTKPPSPFGGNPAQFIENKGQWPQEVLFLARFNGLNAWITQEGAVFDFYQWIKNDENIPGQGAENTKNRYHKSLINQRQGHVVRIRHRGSLAQVTGVGEEEKSFFFNYFYGNDPSRWARNVRVFEKVIIKNLYPGIDVRWYFDRGMLRHDYIVTPGADYSQIGFYLEGARQISIEKGDVLFTTRFGRVRLSELFAYQETPSGRKQVSAYWKQEKDAIRLIVPHYDENLPLIIDPIVYCTFVGVQGSEFPVAIAADDLGNTYITGQVPNIPYPTTTGAYDDTFNGGLWDAFVTKLNSSMNNLVFSTFLGGSGNEEFLLSHSLKSIFVDANYNVYVAGETTSNDFPVSTPCFDNTLNGGSDIFITKLNPLGNNLIYSTYLGGSDDEFGASIIVNNVGDAVVSGGTESPDFPAGNNFGAGASEIFVAKINNSGTSLVLSTIVGGSENEFPGSIALDGSGNIYLAGRTFSNDFPVLGAVDGSFNGANNFNNNTISDAFYLKLNSSGNVIQFSSFLGGDLSDGAIGIKLDNNGDLYVVGRTESNDFPTTSGSFMPNYCSFCGNLTFVTKINTSGNSIVYSTYMGGTNSGNEEIMDFSVDPAGHVFLVGFTGRNNFPIGGPGQDQTFNGFWDGFLAKLNPAGNGLLYSTFFGGEPNNNFGDDLEDWAAGVALDASGDMYVVGYTSSNNFPVTAGAYDVTHSDAPSSTDIFVTKLTSCVPMTFYLDADGDGFGDPQNSVTACSPPPGYVSNSSDCNDANANVNPNVPEDPCNGVDDNCNGVVDEGALTPISLNSASCNITVNDFSHVLRAIHMPGAVQYQFEFFDSLGNTYYYEYRPNRGFYFSLWNWPEFNRSYKVRVRWFNGSTWSCWGSVCIVNTPPMPTTQLQPGNCNITGVTPSQVLRAIQMPGADEYEFEFFDGTNYYYATRPNNAFYFALFNWDSFNTTYTVRVRWRRGNTWSDWGAPCTVTTGPMPTTQLRPSDCDATVTSNTQVLRANVMSGAIQYEFRISNGSNTWYLLRPNQGFYFRLFGLPAGSFPAGAYTVEVRWKDAGTGMWSDWGPVCNITLANTLDQNIEEPAISLFEVQAFPVPFDHTLSLIIEALSTDPVYMNVIDMQGRLIESRIILMENSALLSLGESWADGVYAILLQQGGEIRTLRVVKSH